MKREATISNKIPKRLRELLDQWIATRGDSIGDALSGGLILFMTVDNLLKSAAIEVAEILQREDLSMDEMFEALVRARDEQQRKHERAAQLAMPPPKQAGRQKTAG